MTDNYFIIGLFLRLTRGDFGSRRLRSGGGSKPVDCAPDADGTAPPGPDMRTSGADIGNLRSTPMSGDIVCLQWILLWAITRLPRCEIR